MVLELFVTQGGDYFKHLSRNSEGIPRSLPQGDPPLSLVLNGLYMFKVGFLQKSWRNSGFKESRGQGFKGEKKSLIAQSLLSAISDQRLAVFT
jgi:hypothetical protein